MSYGYGGHMKILEAEGLSRHIYPSSPFQPHVTVVTGTPIQSVAYIVGSF